EFSALQGSIPTAGRAVLAPTGDSVIVTVLPSRFYYEPQTSRGPEGRVTTSYILRGTTSTHTIVLPKVNARTAGGDRLTPAQFAERLRTEVPVFLVLEGDSADPSYLQLLKPDTLILGLAFPPPTPPPPP